MAKNVIVTCAVTGSSHTPTMSPHLPFTPDAIVHDAIAACRAGAASIHLHARDPQDGRPSASPVLFREYCERIKTECDGVISLSTGGATGQTVEERLEVVRQLQPELCTCNLGTMNYGGFGMIPRYQGTWRFEWEEPYLESTRHEPFVSNFSDIEYMLKTLTQDTGTKLEFEAYDIGHLYTLAYYLETKLVEPPLDVQFVMGTMGGIGPDTENVMYMKQTATRLLGDDVNWGILGSGRFQFGLVTAGALMGGNVRVGLEDGLYLRKGVLATNEEQVQKMVRLLDELSLEIATPDEMRERMGLKGRENVKF